jgi:23S rRNA (uracil1939-C5)-methyltransferase
VSETQEVDIVRLGSQGDGVADGPSGPLYVSRALPGERWRIGPAEGAPVLISAPAPRREPVCRHFGRCGSCMAQHMPADLYAEWKRSIVQDAFAHRGIEAGVAPLVRVGLHSRRRAFLGVERQGRRVVIGFREEGQHTLVDMAECPVLDRALVALLPHLRDMAVLAMPAGVGGRLVVTLTAGGPDVSFDNGHRALTPEAQSRLAELSAGARLARLTVHGEPIVERARTSITCGSVAVDVPQSLFLQAVPEAERHLVDLVTAALPKKAKRVADLFSGLGTFTFPLARRVQVLAVDSDRRAIAALASAARHARGLKPIEARVRDLFREPMSARELDPFDCVVLDPPRAGAQEQAERIANSKVPVVIAVSCAPATLARDARILIDGGYTMGPVTPVDQFLFTPHVEAVAVFRR